MPNKNYQAGRRWEYQVAKQYRDMGCTVMRTAGSHGPFDLVALAPITGLVYLIQCKLVSSLRAEDREWSKFHEATLNWPYGDNILPILRVKVRGR